ncbi:unnamed protein product [Trichogramma brassicae]|uniref:Uncharacterized protein n=1 Tax=Trichogramma brassicae TaxID=86971 RepID=A0A6H5I6N5_9HYME|nr:unnamed protein product [Trichogramma brassicae]
MNWLNKSTPKNTRRQFHYVESRARIHTSRYIGIYTYESEKKASFIRPRAALYYLDVICIIIKSLARSNIAHVLAATPAHWLISSVHLRFSLATRLRGSVRQAAAPCETTATLELAEQQQQQQQQSKLGSARRTLAGCAVLSSVGERMTRSRRGNGSSSSSGSIRAAAAPPTLLCKCSAVLRCAACACQSFSRAAKSKKKTKVVTLVQTNMDATRRCKYTLARVFTRYTLLFPSFSKLALASSTSSRGAQLFSCSNVRAHARAIFEIARTFSCKVGYARLLQYTVYSSSSSSGGGGGGSGRRYTATGSK